jgi:ubiquinone/menaquinone biosynthesis C-methylase UbiE
MELQYEIFKVLFGGRNFFAPLDDPRKILDIGTGPGKWAIEMGMRAADAQASNVEHADNGRELLSQGRGTSSATPPNACSNMHQVTGTDLSPIQPEWYVPVAKP